MEDRLAINLAKTELREGFNTGDVDRVLAVFQDSFTDWSHGSPGKYGSESRSVLKQKLTDLFSRYNVKMTLIIVDIGRQGDVMHEWGWNEYTLTPKATGDQLRKRERYYETWTKCATGEWKISFLISNEDVPEILNGYQTRWFRSERTDSPAVGD